MQTSQVVVLHAPGAAVRAEQGSVYATGISAETAGANALWLGMISLPAGQRTGAHFHAGHETALYMMSGVEVDLYTGGHLEQHHQLRPGDYLFIPPGIPHVAANRSDTPAVFIGARTDPNANESVVMLPSLDEAFAAREHEQEGRSPKLAL